VPIWLLPINGPYERFVDRVPVRESTLRDILTYLKRLCMPGLPDYLAGGINLVQENQISSHAEGRNSRFPRRAQGLGGDLADFDQAGFPKDFLTSADRDQQPSQEREDLWSDFEASRQSPHATDEGT
jgi:hypothetical protein